MMLAIQTSAAFDNEGKRDPDRDDWKFEEIGDIPPEMLKKWIAGKYKDSIRVFIVPEYCIERTELADFVHWPPK